MYKDGEMKRKRDPEIYHSLGSCQKLKIPEAETQNLVFQYFLNNSFTQII